MTEAEQMNAGEMTDKEFCDIMTGFDGEPMDKVEQLTHISFTGRELKEFAEHVLRIEKNKPKQIR